MSLFSGTLITEMVAHVSEQGIFGNYLPLRFSVILRYFAKTTIEEQGKRNREIYKHGEGIPRILDN